MSKIRIFSKKAFAIGEGFRRETDSIDSFITVPNAFQDMPDKYVNDATFKAAVKCGDITIIDSKAAEMAAQDDMTVNSVDNTPTTPTALEAFYEELKGYGKDDTIRMAEKYNVKPVKDEKLGQLKKRILEAYKLENPED